jgi:hypothetical protein
MADTVDTAASSPGDEPKEPRVAAPPGEPDEPQGAAPPEEPEEPQGAAPADEAEEPQDDRSGLLDDEVEPRVQEAEERHGEEAEEPQDDRSLTELFEQLGRELSELGVSEAQLEAARNMPEVRRAARDIVGALIVVIAAVTAFAFVNVAAVEGLSRVMATWLAALVLAAAWIAVLEDSNLQPSSHARRCRLTATSASSATRVYSARTGSHRRRFGSFRTLTAPHDVADNHQDDDRADDSSKVEDVRVADPQPDREDEIPEGSAGEADQQRKCPTTLGRTCGGRRRLASVDERRRPRQTR